MRDIQRIAELADDQHIPPFTKPPRLSTLPAPNFVGPKDRKEAQNRLLDVRHRLNGNKNPSKSYKVKFGLRNEADIEKINSTFTPQERRDGFDYLLQSRQSAGIAQAILDFHPQQKLDINVRRDQPPSKGSLKRHPDAGNNIVSSRWLQIATETNQEDFVRLLASREAAQSSLDESLKIAIRQSSIALTTELIRYGANGNTCHREFHDRANNEDMDWTALLLNSRFHVIDQTERDKALLTAVEKRRFDMAHLLLSFGADANYLSGLPIFSAIQNSDLRMLTLLITGSSNLEQESLQKAIESACTSANLRGSIRDDTIDIILSAGAETPPPVLEKLLVSAVHSKNISLVSLLVKHRQIPVATATKAMDQLPDNLTEDEAIEISRLLFAVGAEGKCLGAQLYWAVRKDYDQMIGLLVDHGVCLDFKEAIAIRFALQRQDTVLLNLLLNGNETAAGNSISDPQLLARVLPQALDIGGKSKRHEAVRLLLRKGVKGPCVDQALLDVVTKPAVCDGDLVQMLLAGGASVNFGNDNENCVLNAAEDGNLAIVNLLSEPKWRVLPHILSKAVLRVYKSRRRLVHPVVIALLTLLLQREAECSGDLVAQTLVLAIQASNEGDCMEIVELLLKHGANVNFQGGEPIREALKLADDRVLTAICRTKRIKQTSFAKILQPAIEVSRVNQSKLSILLHSCQDFQAIISDAVIAEVGGESSSGQDEIVKLLLENGGDVNHGEGAVFTKAIEIKPPSKSIEYLCLLLAKGPRKAALGTAFDSARKVQCPLDHRYKLFRSILEAGYDGHGIHLALAECIISSKDDLTIPRLLLHNAASVDHERGSVLATATESGNIQLVNMLLAHNPNKSTVNRAFKAACHAHVSDSCRLELLKCLLATNNVTKDCVTYALTHVIIHGSTDEVILGLLARHGPKIENEALLSLINRQEIGTTRFLFEFQVPSETTRSHAFRSCFDLEREIRLAFAELIVVAGIEDTVWKAALLRSVHDEDVDLLSLLLNHSLQKRLEIDEALVLAADTMNPDIVQNLLCHGPSPGAIDRGFDKMLSSGRMRSTTNSIAAAKMLLESGISQSLRDLALVQSLEAIPRERTDFYQVLIQHGADVSTKSCICFKIAGQFDDVEIFSLLLQSAASFDLVIKSLVSNFPQNRYARLLELLFLTLTCPQYRNDHSDVELIFEAMRRFHRGDGLIRLLLDHNYPVGQTLRSGNGNTLTPEAVTPVIWALGQAESEISDDVILALLQKEEEAQPNFTTEESEITAISLAARFGRHAIIQRLIELGVDLSAVDSSGRSPLFYAAANGDSKSVILLLENGAQCNDGSLHEAARLCQRSIVALLLQSGHDPDYSCDLHDGRTALGALCSQPDLRSGGQISAVYETMRLLISAPTNLSFRTRGKTVLQLALDNETPVGVTKALLRFPEIYKDIQTHSERFIYEDIQGRFMSPDVYVKQYCKSENHFQSQLIELLEKKGCMRKWFTKKGNQLADCEGLPPALKEAMDQQDIADQAEQRAIQRHRTSSKADLEIMQHRHKAAMIQSKEQADLNLYNVQRVNDQQIAHDNALSSQRRNNMTAERADERWHIQQKNKIEYDAARDRNQLEYSSQSQLKQLEYASQKEKDKQRFAALQQEANIERDLLESREAAEKRSQSRAMERFSRQDASVRLAAQEQRALIAAAKESRVGNQSGQLALQWDQPE